MPPTPLPVLELIFQLASYKHVDHWCFATCFFEGFDGEGEMLASLLFAEWDPCSYIDGEMAISTIAAVHWYTNMDVFVQRQTPPKSELRRSKNRSVARGRSGPLEPLKEKKKAPVRRQKT